MDSIASNLLLDAAEAAAAAAANDNKSESSASLESLIDDGDRITVFALLSLSYCNQPASSLLSSTNGKRCRFKQCYQVATKRSPFCQDHIGSRTCEMIGCSKYAQGGTQFCISHGGGHRCTFPGCNKGARGKYFCALHGGGKRCSMTDCNKLAVGGSSCCAGHGGGKKCISDGCTKAAQSPTKFCVRHGGGRQCNIQGCMRVSRGKTGYCASHGHARLSIIPGDDNSITTTGEDNVYYDDSKDMKGNLSFDCITPPLQQFCLPAGGVSSPMRYHNSSSSNSMPVVFNFPNVNHFVFEQASSPSSSSASRHQTHVKAESS